MDVTPDYKIQLARQLRKRQTPAEAVLWQRLRGHQVNGLGFRRQRPIGRFVADFCCEAEKIVVEVDGGYHDTIEQREMDVERAAHFTGRGYQVLRFTNDEVTTHLEVVLSRIAHAVLVAAPPRPLSRDGRGEFRNIHTATATDKGCNRNAAPIAWTPLSRRGGGAGGGGCLLQRQGEGGLNDRRRKTPCRFREQSR